MPQVTSIDDVIAQLDTIIADARAQDSPAAVFAALYRAVTIAVRDRCNDGHFADNARMRRLDVTFANRYFAAYDAFHAGETPTAPWKTAFDAGGERWVTLIQHILLGINAHIILDLGAAVAEIGRDHGWDDTLQTDFDRLNAILGAMVDQSQAAVNAVSPFFGFLDVVGGDHDEQIVGFSIEAARNAAWRFAELLRDSSPASWPEVIAGQGRIAGGYASHLRRPRAWRLWLILMVIAIGERGKIGALVDGLSANT